MQIGLEQIWAIRRMERAKHRKTVLLTAAVLLILSVLFLCLRGRGMGLMNPLEVFQILLADLRVRISSLWNGAAAQNREEILGAYPYYAETIIRFKSLLLMLMAGAVLSLSGTIYQSAMQNPMAVPTMLGVSSGVSFAQMVLVILYAESAWTMRGTRYLLSYGFSFTVLLIILLLGRLAGGKKTSVADMLIVGTVINRLIQVVMNYLQSSMDEETLLLYQEFAQNSQDYFDSFLDLGILLLVSFVVLLPVFLMRFTFNLVCFADDDGMTLGINPRAMRVYGLIAGGILTSTAMIHAGNIGMLSMVVPLLCRYLTGADLRNLLGTTAAWGGITLLTANLIRIYTYMGEYQIPLGNIVSLLSVPLLIWIIWRNRSAWAVYER